MDCFVLFGWIDGRTDDGFRAWNLGVTRIKDKHC
jgi:hypothetical protein